MKLPLVVLLATLLTGCATKENVYFCRDLSSDTRKELLKPGQSAGRKAWLGPEELYRFKVTSSTPVEFTVSPGTGEDFIKTTGTSIEGFFITKKGKKETVIGVDATALERSASIQIVTEKCKPKRMPKERKPVEGSVSGCTVTSKPEAPKNH